MLGPLLFISLLLLNIAYKILPSNCFACRLRAVLFPTDAAVSGRCFSRSCRDFTQGELPVSGLRRFSLSLHRRIETRYADGTRYYVYRARRYYVA